MAPKRPDKTEKAPAGRKPEVIVKPIPGGDAAHKSAEAKAVAESPAPVSGPATETAPKISESQVEEGRLGGKEAPEIRAEIAEEAPTKEVTLELVP